MKEEVAVIGAGQMGSGIAQVFATAGFCVRVYDISKQMLNLARVRIRDSLNKLHEKGSVTEPVEDITFRIDYFYELEDLSGCKIFIESAFEDFDIKTNILYKLSQYAGPDSFIASNTSSLSITSLSKMLRYPDKFLGFHFMNPPPLMDLIEVIRGFHTSDSTFQFFMNLARTIKKVPISCKNTPGFVLNRILILMINEAVCTLYDGTSSAEQIDETMKLGANHRMGPLALADLIGLDTVLSILKNLKKESGNDKYTPCPLLQEYVRQGRLGRKSNKGFFEY